MTWSGDGTPTEAHAEWDNLGGYRFVSVLGQGSFGTVLRARDTSTTPPCDVAIKMLERGPFMAQNCSAVKAEILNQSRLVHGLIIQVIEVFLTSTHVGIVMEYAPGGTVYSYVATRRHMRLSEVAARWVFQQLILAVDFCHRAGVANRDVKLENLLLDRAWTQHCHPMLKMCDFGFSLHESHSSGTTPVGTFAYMAPEIFLGTRQFCPKRADLWSCGVILYAMVTGHMPFNTGLEEGRRRLVAAQFAFPAAESGMPAVSEGCRDLIAGLLRADPAQRLTPAAILGHPWFAEDLVPGAADMNDNYLELLQSDPLCPTVRGPQPRVSR